MLSISNKQIVFSSALCNRCGACLSSCGAGALSLLPRHPVFDIQVDMDACVLCTKCVKICPAAQLPERPLREEDFETPVHICLAAAQDEKVRFDASSGGVARTLAKAALESGFVDAVYGVRQSATAPYYEGGYFFDAGEVSQMANSVYCAFPFAANLKKKPAGSPLKRLLFIGTNCQLQGAENFYKGTQTEVFQLAIYCKQQKTLDYVRWLRREMSQPEDLDALISFRGDGWPGQIRSAAKTLSSYFFAIFGLETWRVPGCQICPNPFGWNSDLVLLDPWSLVNDKDRAGFTLVILRNEKAQRLWETARHLLLEHSQIPEDLAARPCLAGRALTGEDVKHSIDWWRYRRTKVDSIPFYLGQETHWLRKIGYTVLEWQRAINGLLFLRFRNKKVQYVLLRIWGKASKAILLLVGKPSPKKIDV